MCNAHWSRIISVIYVWILCKYFQEFQNGNPINEATQLYRKETQCNVINVASLLRHSLLINMPFTKEDKLSINSLAAKLFLDFLLKLVCVHLVWLTDCVYAVYFSSYSLCASGLTYRLCVRCVFQLVQLVCIWFLCERFTSVLPITTSWCKVSVICSVSCLPFMTL